MEITPERSRMWLSILVVCCLAAASGAWVLGESSVDYRPLRIDELRRLGLLDEQELAAAENYRHVEIKGALLDLDGKPGEELVICSSTVADPEVGSLNGVIRILIKRYPMSPWEVVWRVVYPDTAYLIHCEPHRIDKAGTIGFFSAFTNMGGVYYPTWNVLLWYEQGRFWTLTIEAAPGPIELSDLDGDGVAEIITHNRYTVDRSMPLRLTWYEIWNLEDGRLVDRSSRFPEFYQDKIERYEKNITRATETLEEKEGYQAEALAQYIEDNKVLIARARELIAAKPKK